MNNQILYTILLLFCGFHIAHSQTSEHKAMNMIPKQPSDIFIGAAMNSKSINNDVYQFVESPFSEITISSSIPGARSKIIEPTYDNMITALSENITAVGGELNTSSSFSFSIRELSSYSALSVYWGQNINLSDLFGVSADHKSKNLVAVEISLALFSVYMDMPSSPPAETSSDNIYVGSISFGRKVIVVVESYFEFGDIKSSINDMLDEDGQLSKRSKVVVANSTFRVVNVGNKPIEITDVDNLLSGVVDYVSGVGTATDFGIPISFEGAYINDSSQFENNF